MLRPRPNNHNLESCPPLCACRLSLGSLKILFSDQTPLASQREQQNCLRIRIALSMSPSAQHVPDGSWPRLHVWSVPTHEPTTVSTSPGSLCLPQGSTRQLLAIFFHTIFLLDVDALERFLRHFEVLRFLWVHCQQRFPHQRVELLFHELVLCWRFKHFLNHRQQIVVVAIWTTVTKQQIVTPLHLDAFSKAMPNIAINTLRSALGRTCCSRSMNFNSGKGAPVATNRILSLLSPLVVTSASEGGRGRQGITLMSVKRHGKQNVAACAVGTKRCLSLPLAATANCEASTLDIEIGLARKRGMSSPISYL